MGYSDDKKNERAIHDGAKAVRNSTAGSKKFNDGLKGAEKSVSELADRGNDNFNSSYGKVMGASSKLNDITNAFLGSAPSTSTNSELDALLAKTTNEVYDNLLNSSKRSVIPKKTSRVSYSQKAPPISSWPVAPTSTPLNHTKSSQPKQNKTTQPENKDPNAEYKRSPYQIDPNADFAYDRQGLEDLQDEFDAIPEPNDLRQSKQRYKLTDSDESALRDEFDNEPKHSPYQVDSYRAFEYAPQGLEDLQDEFDAIPEPKKLKQNEQRYELTDSDYSALRDEFDEPAFKEPIKNHAPSSASPNVVATKNMPNRLLGIAQARLTAAEPLKIEADRLLDQATEYKKEAKALYKKAQTGSPVAQRQFKNSALNRLQRAKQLKAQSQVMQQQYDAFSKNVEKATKVVEKSNPAMEDEKPSQLPRQGR